MYCNDGDGGSCMEMRTIAKTVLRHNKMMDIEWQVKYIHDQQTDAWTLTSRWASSEISFVERGWGGCSFKGGH